VRSTRAWMRGCSSAPSHIGLSSRGGPGSTSTVRPSGPGTTRPGAVPIGSSGVAPSGTMACLRFAASSAFGSSLIGEVAA